MPYDPTPSPAPEQSTLSYPTPPSPADEGWRLGHGPLASVLAVLAALVTATMLLVVPRAEDVFRDFKTDLPAVTRALIALAHVGRGFVWLAVWILPFLPQAILSLRGPTDDLPARRRALRRWRLLATLATIAFVAAVLLSFLLPYVHLIDSVGGASGPRH